jgi:predicted MFS family arabinose efflux permease
METKPDPSPLLGIIVAASLSRAVINTAKRFMYPFAPVISRGLGIPLTEVTSAIAVNQAASLAGIFFSHLGDRAGYRRLMLTGLVLLVAGMLLAGCLPFHWALLTAMLLCGLGKTLFDPAIQAYVSNRVPFRRRGLVIGILETSWAAATLAGIPLAGLLIDRLGWRSPFFALAGAGLGCIAVVLFYIRDDASPEGTRSRKGPGLARSMGELIRNRQVLGALGFGFFYSFANDTLFVVYGAWLESSFSLSAVSLGLGTGVIGVAELAGELGTAALADRIGLKRSVFGGGVLLCLATLALPWAGGSVAHALAGLFAVFLFFEFSIVSFLSVCTELSAGSRATMMSLFFLAAGLGRVAGAFLGGFLWKSQGLEGVCMTSAALSLTGLVLLLIPLGTGNPAGPGGDKESQGNRM